MRLRLSPQSNRASKCLAPPSKRFNEAAAFAAEQQNMRLLVACVRDPASMRLRLSPQSNRDAKRGHHGDGDASMRLRLSPQSNCGVRPCL